MQDIAITIIVPFWNVKEYIAECIQSIIAHTRQDLEVLLIDDCSQDSSRIIAEQYAKRDSRIRIIEHETNKKQGGARNTGIRVARGDYIWFVDSDDSIAFGSIDALYNYAVRTQSDVLLFDMYCYSQTGKYKPCVYKYLTTSDKLSFVDIENLQVYRGNDLQCMLLQLRYTNPTALPLFFSKKFILQNNLFFKENIFYEDAIILLWLTKAQSITYCPDCPFYKYRSRPNSVMTTQKKTKQMDEYKIAVMRQIVNFVDTKESMLVCIALSRLFSMLLWQEVYEWNNIKQVVNILSIAKFRFCWDTNLLLDAMSVCKMSEYTKAQLIHLFCDQTVQFLPIKRLVKKQIRINRYKALARKYLPDFAISVLKKISKQKSPKVLPNENKYINNNPIP